MLNKEFKNHLYLLFHRMKKMIKLKIHKLKEVQNFHYHLLLQYKIMETV